MSTSVSRRLVSQVGHRLGLNEAMSLALLASLKREGLDGALRRFPTRRGGLLREATTLRDQHLLDVPGLHDRCFTSTGLDWSLSAPVMLDSFAGVVHDRDPFRVHFRVQMEVADVATGRGQGSHLGGQAATQLAERDPVLRIQVCRELGPLLCGSLTRFLNNQSATSQYFRRFVKQISRLLTQVDRLAPYTSLRARRIPHFSGDDWHRVSVDATIAITFELNMDSHGENRVVVNPEVITDGNYFEVQGAARILRGGAAELAGKDAQTVNALASRVEALAPLGRRRRNQEAIDQGADKPLHTSMTLEEGDQKVTVELHHPAHSVHVLEASIGDESEVAMAWWKEHRGLIQPTLAEVASDSLRALGSTSKHDVDTLVDLAFPALHAIAMKRQPQLEVSLDAAVVGLARMLRQEFVGRLR